MDLFGIFNISGSFEKLGFKPEITFFSALWLSTLEFGFTKLNNIKNRKIEGLNFWFTLTGPQSNIKNYLNFVDLDELSSPTQSCALVLSSKDHFFRIPDNEILTTHKFIHGSCDHESMVDSEVGFAILKYKGNHFEII